MTQIAIPGSRAGAAILAVTRKALPRLEHHLMGESARIAYAAILETQRVDTDTLRSSTNVSAGEAEGRNLTYGLGNSPLPITVVDQALAARRFGERLVILEDAQHDGFPYGVVIEARYGTFAHASAAVRGAAGRIVARAGAATLKEVLA